MRVVEYKIVLGYLENLGDGVNEMIAKGWQPLGGVAPDTDRRLGDKNPHRHLYVQAMVRYESQ